MAAETTQTMDAVLKIGYLHGPDPGEKALAKVRRRRLLQKEEKERRERSVIHGNYRS